MAFPPPKKNKPQAGPQQGPPPMDPMMGGMGGPPMGGPPPGPPMPPPGLPSPGMPVDPMMAMLGSVGPGNLSQAQSSGSYPAGPDGFPLGGSMPMGDGDGDDGLPDMGQSPLLAALMGAMSQSDPYGVAPGEPDNALDGGTGDPGMGLDQLLQLLALAKMGVGPGGSGAPVGADPTGLAAGLAGPPGMF